MESKFIELHVYDAMVDFLHDYAQRRYGYGILQEILKELSPLPEGGTSNPAMWAEWERCINRSLKEPLDAANFGDAAKRQYTKEQSFNAMVDFFITYYKRTSNGDLNKLIDIICSFPKDYIDKETWNDWNNAAKKALQRQDNKKFVDKFRKRKLTILQAYNAMVKFLDEYYEETSVEFIDLMSGAMSFLPDGDTIHSTYWIDWDLAVKEVLQEQGSEICMDKILGISLTESLAFKAMIKFLVNYYERGPDPDIRVFFDYLHLLPDGSSGSPIIRKKWKQCVDEALKEEPGSRKYLILGED